jgi:quinol monooxygenase YgiN
MLSSPCLRSVSRYANVRAGIPEGGMTMAVLIRHRPQGLTSADYDRIGPSLVASLKQQPGFVLHVAYEDPEGFVVGEVWESQEQHDAWFNETVVPNVPVEITQEVIQLHAVERPS